MSEDEKAALFDRLASNTQRSPLVKAAVKEDDVRQRLTRRGRPRKVFRYLEEEHSGLVGGTNASPSNATPPFQPSRPARKAVDVKAETAPPHHPPSQTESHIASTKEADSSKRRKVSAACIFCRRSHMTCDDQRPCQRCIQRGISHLCADAPSVGDTSQDSKVKSREKGKYKEKEKSKQHQSSLSKDDSAANQSQKPTDYANAPYYRFVAEPETGRERQDYRFSHSSQFAPAPIALENGARGLSGASTSQFTGIPSDRHSWTAPKQKISAAVDKPSRYSLPAYNAEFTGINRSTPASLKAPVMRPSTSSISLPQLLLQQRSPSSTRSSPIGSHDPLAELQRLLADIAMPSTTAGARSSSPLLNPAEYAALRRGHHQQLAASGSALHHQAPHHGSLARPEADTRQAQPDGVGGQSLSLSPPFWPYYDTMGRPP